MTSPLVIPVEEYLVPSLPEFWFGLLMFSLAMYVFLDGFDFGVGILYATCKTERERETFLAAFGPLWKANEVWLVAFGTFLIAAFPPVYARLLSEHYLLAIAIVLALIFRGIAPKLREERDDESWKRLWDRSFVAGSLCSPFLLGVLVGSWVFAAGTISLPSLATGVVVVALSIASGAALLGLKTRGDVQRTVTRLGQPAAVAYLLSVVVLLIVVLATDAGEFRAALVTPPVLAVVVATVVLGIAAPILARRGAYRAWFASVAGLSLLLVGLVAILLYPTIYPAADLTIRDAVVSPVSLNLTTILGLPVLLVVLAYFRYLYRVFAGPVDEHGYGEGY